MLLPQTSTRRLHLHPSTYGHMPSVDTPPNVGSCLGLPHPSTGLLVAEYKCWIEKKDASGDHSWLWLHHLGFVICLLTVPMAQVSTSTILLLSPLCILSSTLCGTHCIVSQLAHFTHYLTCWVMLACFFLLQDSVEFQKLCVSHLSRLSHKWIIFWESLKFTLDFVEFKNVTIAWFPGVKEVGTSLIVLQWIKFPYLFLHLLNTMLRLLSLVLG